jgi:hypothetical protein
VDDRAEIDLAWDLVALVGLHISIGTLLETIVRASVPVPFALALRINDWHHPYVHHAGASRLHELLTTVRSLVDMTDGDSHHDAL